jgi:FeS assembly SUF system regulator
VIRISKLTDYATVLLARLAAQPQSQFTSAQLAAGSHLATPTVSKLLKQLQRGGLVASTRGAHGGYRLARPAGEITAAQILDAMEGPMALTDCARDVHQCGIESTCGVGRAWQRVNVAIRRSLQEISLLDLAGLSGEPVHFAALERQLRRQAGGTRTAGTPGKAQ